MTRYRPLQTALLTLLSFTLSIVVHANSLDISLNQQTAQLKLHKGTDVAESEQGGAKLGILFNEDSDFMAYGTFLVPDDGSNGFQVSPGVKLSYINLDKGEGNLNSTLAIGLKLGGVLPVGTPLLVYGSLFYAPAVTSFDQIESSFDSEFGIKLPLSDNAVIYAAYRKLVLDIKDIDKDVNLDDAGYFGFAFSF